jgi:DNA-binding beta-propeller fold protein YncE
MRIFLSLWIAACAVASAQLSPVPPPPTALPSHPFFITKSWRIGGVGDWDYMTMDPNSRELFIAHGPNVQVVNVDSGTVAGTVRGLREAHAIVLDDSGEYGYVSDGPAGMVRVFDRRNFQIVASIPTGSAPRSMALDAPSGLLFVICSEPAGGGTARSADVQTGKPGPPSPPNPASRTRRIGSESTVAVINADQRVPLAQIVLPGKLGFAQADGDGRIYITVSDRNQILRLDAQAIGSALHRIADTQAVRKPESAERHGEKVPVLDWTPGQRAAPPAEAYPYAISLDSNCQQPRALAFDSAHGRIFAACSNFRMVVLNAATGQGIEALPIGPGPDAIGYDASRGLIFTANGDGDGSLTIIRQDVTDTYSVIQTLPTRQHARTLAIDASTGNVYLTSVLYGADLNQPPVNGAPLKIDPIESSFQVLVVGN